MKRKIVKFMSLLQDFGVLFTTRYVYLLKSKKYIPYIKLIDGYLCNLLSEQIKRFNSMSYTPSSGKKSKIWFCWWQGEENMPYLCSVCLKKLRNSISNDYQVIFISKHNFQQYVDIPKFILKKLEDGIIPVTQFCDILRNKLLYQNGGTWIDASIYVSGELIQCIDNDLDFWSIKLSEIDDREVWGQLISECRWSSFIMSARKGNPISLFVYEGMCEYYKEHNSTIDYFLQNMLIKIAYDNVSYIRELIDKIPVSNTHVYDLYKCMEEPYDEEKLRELLSDTAVFKLTQKRAYESSIMGVETFYGHLFCEE